MRDLLKIVNVVFFSLVLIAIMQSCKKESLPTVTTVSVSDITHVSAVSVSYIADDGGSLVLSRGICWDISPNPTINSSKTIDGKGSGVFISNITGLKPNTEYNVRAYATNSEGLNYGNEITFFTIQILTASLTTAPVTSITQKSVVTGGNITSDGGEAVTARGVCWGFSGNPTINNNKTTDGTGIGSFVSNIIGLTEKTTYYVRAYAINSEGISYGNEISFTTSPIRLPTLTTSEVSSTCTTSAISGGSITSDGGGSISIRGVCWNTSGNPNINDDDRSYDGHTVGDFSSTMMNLKRGTKYYVRAYATNEAGTAYGNQLSFTTAAEVSPIVFNPDLSYETITDIEGNIYKTIQIGTQTWMAENLKTTKLNDGTAIPLVTDNINWLNRSTPGYCWYDNDVYYKSYYGALYNWYPVSTGKLCPTGWHVPSDLEWTILCNYLENTNVAGGKLKETGTLHWLYPNTGATNESGFTALPGGWRYSNGVFRGIYWMGIWWSSTEFNTGSTNNPVASYFRGMHYDSNDASGSGDSKVTGYSIRCLKD